MTLKFGTGGFPLTTKNKSVISAIKRIRELGLDCMELEFVYQIFVKEESAEEVKKMAESQNVDLTVHGSYFINLAAKEEHKRKASIQRVLDAAMRADGCGAKSVTFHAAAFMQRSHDVVYSLVKDSIKEIFDNYDKNNLNVMIAPEVTGKASQFGDLEDLIALMEDIKHKNLKFCFDFAHKHARDGGGWNSSEEFEEMITTIRTRLGQEFLDSMHIHISGINYSQKGERNHLTFLPSIAEYKKQGIDVGELDDYYKTLEEKGRLETPDLEWKALLCVLKKNNVGGWVICESPNLEQDALLMKNYYDSLK